MPLRLPRPARSTAYIGMVRDALRAHTDMHGLAGAPLLPALVSRLEREIAAEYGAARASVAIAETGPRCWACRVAVLGPDGDRLAGEAFRIAFSD